MPEMFLRFYGATPTEIDECLQKLESLTLGLISTSRECLQDSVNVVLPDAVNTEVTLVFQTLKQLRAFRANDEGISIYLQYAAPMNLGARFRKQEFGDPVWRHGEKKCH